MVAVVSTDMARYYAAHGIVAMLPIRLPWRMDAFGIVTRTDRLLSSAAQLMLRAFRTAALAVCGHSADTVVAEPATIDGSVVAISA